MFIDYACNIVSLKYFLITANIILLKSVGCYLAYAKSSGKLFN